MKPDSASAGSHLTQDQIAEYLYGDAAPELAAHVAACPECGEECDAVYRTLQLLRNWEAPELAPGYESAVWQKLAASLPQQRRAFRFRRPNAVWTAAAALAAMIVVAISLQFAGSRVQEPPADTAQASDAGQRILSVAVTDHIERTMAVLSPLVNAEPQHPARFTDVSVEQNTVEDLLAENRLYRQTAVQDKDRNTAALLDEIGQVLVELEHSPAKLSGPQAHDLQQRLADSSLLSKMRGFVSSNPSPGENGARVIKL
ncbi:MAG TPA: hypothetical protein VN737_09445 [Bryobacteraceae bacterium]|nr:hypothetical protein [Bryobacteraceae bacterium]